MPSIFYYVGRFLQLLGMSILLWAIVEAGPLGPSFQTFATGVVVFLTGWWIVGRFVP